MAALTNAEVASRMAEIPDWNHEGVALRRLVTFENFREAVAFLVLLAFDCEEADHHPDITLNYRRIKFSLSTHSKGGITEKDFKLAKAINKHLTKWGA